MEAKKTQEADLENKRFLFMNIGFIFSLLVVISAFSYYTKDKEFVDLGTVDEALDEQLDIPITEQPPPPPPKIQQPEIIEVPDEEEIEEEIEIDLDIEIDEDAVVEDIIFDDQPEEEVAEEIFTVVEDQPTFPGGDAAFYQFVADNVEYPPQARRMGIEGRVYVQFVVDKDGRITEVQAVRGIGAGCDEEAERVIKAMPRWSPGKQRGRPVKVRMILPITFRLGG